MTENDNRPPPEERKPLSPEQREEMRAALKAQMRAYVDALKEQMLGDNGEKKPDLDEAMKNAEMEAARKMAEMEKARLAESHPAPAPSAAETPRDTIDVKAAPEVPEEEAAKSALPKEELDRLTQEIVAALKTVYDPEIPVDIYELGLIYRIDISDDKVITIDMTLTAPGCPVAGDMPGWVQKAVAEVEGVKDVKVNLVFDPPWDMSRMSDEARLALNMF